MLNKTVVNYFIGCDNSKEAWELYKDLLAYVRSHNYSFGYHNCSNFLYTIFPNVACWTGLRCAYRPRRDHEYIFVEAPKVREFLDKEAKNALDMETDQNR